MEQRSSASPLRVKLKRLRIFLEESRENMKMLGWIEGAVLLGIGLIGSAEGLRLTQNIDPYAISDVLGPGYYIFFLGLILMIAGVTHLFSHYRKTLSMKKEPSDRETGKQKTNLTVLYMAVVLVIYLTIINIAGYLVATPIFFLLEFRLAGVKSWSRNVILTLAITTAFYFIFINYCRMVFPPGLFFK